jgi:hypothetical protein
MPEHQSPTPEDRPNLSGKYGILRRMKLGRAVLTLTTVEFTSGVVSVAADHPLPVVVGSIAGAWAAGETIYDFYLNRNHPAENLNRLSRWLAKDETQK